MTDAIRGAIARLGAALDRLDAASIRHIEAERLRSNLEAELAIMREDRHNLASLLDTQIADQVRTEAHLADLVPKVDRAINLVRATIENG